VRLSIPCLQHPLFFDALQASFQKIDLHRLPADLPFQFGYSVLLRSSLPHARERLLWRMLELFPPPVQQVWIDLAPSRYFSNRRAPVQPP